MRDFSDIIKCLEKSRGQSKTRTGRERVAQFLKQLGLEGKIDASKVILVAGTNGKGTTAFFLKQLLMSQGLKVGLFTSPHLVCTTERIQINNKKISKKEFDQIFHGLLPVIDEATHFEALCLIAYHYFVSEKVDYSIFEVGIGGLHDATNAIEHGCSIVTRLGMDHENILGDTLDKIAEQKLGIVRPDSLTIYLDLPNKILAKFQSSNRGRWVRCLDYLATKADEKWGYTLKVSGQEVSLAMLGPRSVENAALAITAFKALGFEKSSVQVLSDVLWPGRMEPLRLPSGKGRLFLSGDHNPQGVQSLFDILKDFPKIKIKFFVSFGRDKKADEMLQMFLNYPQAQVYLGQLRENGYSLDRFSEDLLKRCVWAGTEALHQLERLMQDSQENEWIVVTGSLYWVGAVKRHFEGSINKS